MLLVRSPQNLAGLPPPVRRPFVWDGRAQLARLTAPGSGEAAS